MLRASSQDAPWALGHLSDREWPVRFPGANRRSTLPCRERQAETGGQGAVVRLSSSRATLHLGSKRVVPSSALGSPAPRKRRHSSLVPSLATHPATSAGPAGGRRQGGPMQPGRYSCDAEGEHAPQAPRETWNHSTTGHCRTLSSYGQSREYRFPSWHTARLADPIAGPRYVTAQLVLSSPCGGAGSSSPTATPRGA